MEDSNQEVANSHFAVAVFCSFTALIVSFTAVIILLKCIIFNIILFSIM